jgi:hypothetical protein
MKITHDQVIEYVYNSTPALKFYQFAIGIGFWPDFPHYQIESLVWYLDAAEIDDIKKIDEILVEREEILKKYIAHIYANRKNNWRITPGFLCALAVIQNQPDSFTVKSLVENEWDEDIASMILTSANRFS